MLSFAFLLVLPFCLACDHIDEGEELIEVAHEQPIPPEEEKETSTGRTVLLEDFTGQMCVNCPLGTQVIEQLQEAYGDQLIAVGIHGGPLGFKGNAKVTGLATDVGDEYYNHWGLEYQPVGLVDRGGAVNYTDWTKEVQNELGYVSEMKMALEASLKEGQIDISVEETCLGGDFNGKLQVWVLEDSITATQKMPDGSVNKTYVHNHVFRTAVNGTWGEDLNIAGGEGKKQTLTQAIDEKWNTTNLSIVAFAYNEYGVEQAIKAKVKKEQTK